MANITEKIEALAVPAERSLIAGTPEKKGTILTGKVLVVLGTLTFGANGEEK